MLNWTPDYASGSGLVDEQHKELFKRANALLAACEWGMGREEVESTLEFMEEYVKFHFATEEELMAKYRFPGCAEHKLQHDDFKVRYGVMKARITASSLYLTDILRLHAFLVEWVRAHTMSTDKILGAFLRSCGVNEEVPVGSVKSARSVFHE